MQEILKDLSMYEESPELVRRLLHRVLRTNSPFDCGKDKDAPHASLHQNLPLSHVSLEEMIPSWYSGRSVLLKH